MSALPPSNCKCLYYDHNFRVQTGIDTGHGCRVYSESLLACHEGHKS